MTTETTRQTADRRRRSLVVRWAFAPTLATALVACAAAGIAGDSADLTGALAGSAACVLVLAGGQAVLYLLRRTQPLALLGIALTTYSLQVTVLLAAFVVLGSRPGWEQRLAPYPLALATMACTLAWTAGLLAVARRDRTPAYDLDPVPGGPR